MSAVISRFWFKVVSQRLTGYVQQVADMGRGLSLQCGGIRPMTPSEYHPKLHLKPLLAP